MSSPGSASQSRRPSADLPTAVGPVSTMTRDGAMRASVLARTVVVSLALKRRRAAPLSTQHLHARTRQRPSRGPALALPRARRGRRCPAATRRKEAPTLPSVRELAASTWSCIVEKNRRVQI
eukprot:2758650-Pleurochrysis_carterae.AAC.2